MGAVPHRGIRPTLRSAFHYIGEAMKRPYARPTQYLGDTDFCGLACCAGLNQQAAMQKELPRQELGEEAPPAREIKRATAAYESPETRIFQ